MNRGEDREKKEQRTQPGKERMERGTAGKRERTKAKTEYRMLLVF